MMMYQKPEYLSGYRNPCFLVGQDKNGYYSLIGSENMSSIFTFTVCFPSFFLAGFRKCGTSDITKMLGYHRSVQTGKKEFDFFSASLGYDNHQYFNKDSYTVLDYVTLLKSHALHTNRLKYHDVEKIMVDDSVSSDYGKFLMLGDYSPGYSDVFLKWKMDPNNKGLLLPKYVIPHKIHHLVPDAKILFMLRNPVERIWSYFRYAFKRPVTCEVFNCHNKSALAIQFHQRIRRTITQWRICEQFYKGDSRMCLYHLTEKAFLKNESEEMHFKPLDYKLMNMLMTTLYYIPLMEYYSVFPKKNILIIDLEEYTANRWKFMNDIVLPFLGLPPFTHNETNSIKQRIVNRTKKRVSMLPETRNMLNHFYAPYQEKLTVFTLMKSLL